MRFSPLVRVIAILSISLCAGGYVNAFLLKVGSELCAERIIPQSPDESHGIAEPGRSRRPDSRLFRRDESESRIR